MGGLISGLLGGGSSPGQEQQMNAIKASRGDIQAYRPEAMQARLNALSSMTGAYGGAQNALETLWGAPQTGQNVGRQLRLPPKRMLGHDLPQRPPPQQNPYPGKNSAPVNSEGDFNLLDPLGIFGGR